MNKIMNKFLLAGDQFMPETYLKQPGFTYSACGPFTRNKCRLEVQILFAAMSLIRLVFDIIWFMVNQNI